MPTYNGEWLRYLSRNYTTWPYRLPPGLKEVLDDFSPTNNVDMTPFDPEKFEQVLSCALELADQSVKNHLVLYHTGEHFREVVANGQSIIRVFTNLSGKKIPPLVEQAFIVALVLHDVHHPGSTFRSDARTSLPYNELGTKVTNEWVSSLAADQFAASHGFNPLARLFIAQTIWASTYGGTTPQEEALNLDRIKPTKFFELAMVVADIAPADSFVREMQKGVNVVFGEHPAIPAPTTWSGWLKNRIDFLSGYVIPRMKKFDAACKTKGYQVCRIRGWHQTAESHLVDLADIKNGCEPVLAAIMKNQLARYADRIDLKA